LQKKWKQQPAVLSFKCPCALSKSKQKALGWGKGKEIERHENSPEVSKYCFRHMDASFALKG